MKFLTIQLSLLFISGVAWAQGPIGAFVDRTVGAQEPKFELGYWTERYSTQLRDQAYKVAESKVDAAIPIEQRWVLNPEAKWKEIQTTAKVPGTNRTFPETLYDLRARTDYKFTVAGETAAGISVGGGSASDHPFETMHEMVYDTTAYFTVGVDPRSTFLVLLNLSNLRPVLNNVPIPGFNYGFRLSPRWGILLGFPYTSIWAEPLNGIRFKASYESLVHVDTKIEADLNQIVTAHFGFLSSQEIYKRARRISDGEQIIFTDTALYAGLRSKLAAVILDVTGGYALNRSVIETSDYWRDRSSIFGRQGRGWLGQVSARLRF